MIANKDGGVFPRSADHFMHRLSSRWNPLLATNDVEAAQDRTRTWLLSRQKADGHWVGELEGDTILESEYLLLLAFLGRASAPVCEPCRLYILCPQRREGGWAIFPGRAARVTASVNENCALKL